MNNGKVVVLNTAEAIYEGFVKNSALLSERPSFMNNPATGGESTASCRREEPACSYHENLKIHQPVKANVCTGKAFQQIIGNLFKILC